MTTDITELAQRLKAAADRVMICRDVAETSEIWERTVTPENILALVEALEKAQTERDEFRNRLKLERSILEDADKRIAELESRTVKLPALCVGVVQGEHAVMVPYAAGHWFNKTVILEMLAAAGIKVEAE